jgi:hypothetical protein
MHINTLCAAGKLDKKEVLCAQMNEYTFLLMYTTISDDSEYKNIQVVAETDKEAFIKAAKEAPEIPNAWLRNIRLVDIYPFCA